MNKLHEMSFEELERALRVVEGMLWGLEQGRKSKLGVNMSVTFFDGMSKVSEVDIPAHYVEVVTKVLETMASVELEKMQRKYTAVQKAITQAMKEDYDE